jgi:hypothetical protein
VVPAWESGLWEFGYLPFPVAGLNDRLDISADVKVAFNLNAQRIAGLHEVLKNHVDHVLVENLYVSK